MQLSISKAQHPNTKSKPKLRTHNKATAKFESHTSDTSHSEFSPYLSPFKAHNCIQSPRITRKTTRKSRKSEHRLLSDDPHNGIRSFDCDPLYS